MVYGDRMKLLFRGRKVHFVKGRFGLRKEDLVYKKKEGFISYIALHLHIFVTKWTNYEMIFVYERKIFVYERKVFLSYIL